MALKAEQVVRIQIRSTYRGTCIQGGVLRRGCRLHMHRTWIRHAASVSSATWASICSSTTRRTLDEIDRISTLRFEVPDTSIKSTTHLVWLDAREFIASVGEQLWKFDLHPRPTKAEPIGPHRLKVPHAMRRTASGRYLVYGGMDHPKRGEAREVGIFDLETGDAIRVPLPTTAWHVVCHPVLDVFYAVSFRVLPSGRGDWQQWGMAHLRQYVYEIDAESGQILRHWSAGKEVPAHINSDICVSDTELIFCTGGSQTVVLVDLETMSNHRLIDEHPGLLGQWGYSRQLSATVRGHALAR